MFKAWLMIIKRIISSPFWAVQNSEVIAMIQSQFNTAKRLAAQGMPVFPLAQNTTVPLKGSRGYKDATTNLTQIEQWFDNDQGLNIGMAIKSAGLLVFDVDINHTSQLDGKAAYTKLAKRFKRLPTNTYILKTPHGGLHWFFKYPQSLNIPSKPLCDFNQGLAAFTGIDIVTYSTPAANTKTANGIYQLIDNGVTNPLNSVECPPWLLKLLTKPQTSVKETPYKRQVKGWTGQLLDDVFESNVQQGKRNVYLTSLLGRLFATNCDSSTAHELLIIANSRLSLPLPDSEVNAIFKSILKRDIQKRGEPLG